MEAPHLRIHAGEIYTVLSELYSNALEHGVMGLDSKLKSSADGFAQYYEARARAMDQLNGFVRFTFTSRLDDGAGSLKILVEDSGKGFDYPKDLACWKSGEPSNVGYHGRGLVLLRQLCDSVEYVHPGNAVEVVFRWQEPL